MNSVREQLLARFRDEGSGPPNGTEVAVRCTDHGRFIVWCSPPAPPCRVACPPECGAPPVTKFRKKPVEVDVVGPLTPENRVEIAKWCHGKAEERPLSGPGRGLTQGVVIHTMEGDMSAAYGDYVIRDVKGELFVCKPDTFATTYEPVDGAS